MAYSELIKNFDKIREYMRRFFVYGFGSRADYDMASARSYDNERRRVESWMGGYMRFRQEAGTKEVYLSVDGRSTARNPLHQAFRAKSFTDGDIWLHFVLLDLLKGKWLSVKQVMGGVAEHLEHFEDAPLLDESTVRKKLREYEKLGLVCAEKRGKELYYSASEDSVNEESWRQAVAFFREQDPLGVIGAYVEARQEEVPNLICFKHHYMLNATDSGVLYELLCAIGESRTVELKVRSRRIERDAGIRTVFPYKIYCSTQTGRQYLLAYHYGVDHPVFYRLDSILKVKAGNVEGYAETYRERIAREEKHLWGISVKNHRTLDHVEMDVQVEYREEFIVNRLLREKRCGSVEQVDEQTVRFTADVYDAVELVPWMRTFLGRIVRLECSDPAVTEKFYEDVERMAQLYGGDGDAI